MQNSIENLNEVSSMDITQSELNSNENYYEKLLNQQKLCERYKLLLKQAVSDMHTVENEKVDLETNVEKLLNDHKICYRERDMLKQSYEELELIHHTLRTKHAKSLLQIEQITSELTSFKQNADNLKSDIKSSVESQNVQLQITNENLENMLFSARQQIETTVAGKQSLEVQMDKRLEAHRILEDRLQSSEEFVARLYELKDMQFEDFMAYIYRRFVKGKEKYNMSDDGESGNTESGIHDRHISLQSRGPQSFVELDEYDVAYRKHDLKTEMFPNENTDMNIDECYSTQIPSGMSYIVRRRQETKDPRPIIKRLVKVSQHDSGMSSRFVPTQTVQSQNYQKKRGGSCSGIRPHIAYSNSRQVRRYPEDVNVYEKIYCNPQLLSEAVDEEFCIDDETEYHNNIESERGANKTVRDHRNVVLHPSYAPSVNRIQNPVPRKAPQGPPLGKVKVVGKRHVGTWKAGKVPKLNSSRTRSQSISARARSVTPPPSDRGKKIVSRLPSQTNLERSKVAPTHGKKFPLQRPKSARLFVKGNQGVYPNHMKAPSLSKHIEYSAGSNRFMKINGEKQGNAAKSVVYLKKNIKMRPTYENLHNIYDYDIDTYNNYPLEFDNNEFEYYEHRGYSPKYKN